MGIAPNETPVSSWALLFAYKMFTKSKIKIKISHMLPLEMNVVSSKVHRLHLG